jgi:hypothetical protein
MFLIPFVGTKIFFFPLFELLKLSDFIVELCNAMAIMDRFDVAIFVELALHDEEELAAFAVLQVFHHGVIILTIFPFARVIDEIINAEFI